MAEAITPSDDAGSATRSTMLRSLVMVAICGACFFLLSQRFADVGLADIWSAMGAIPIQTILIALIFGVLSHIALAGYDLLALHRIGKQVPWPRALKGGFSGTVFSQVLGFGLITGSYARARIYRANAINAPTAVALSGLVAAGFFGGVGILLASLILIDPEHVASITGISRLALRIIAAGILIGAIVACCLAAGKTLNIPVIGLHLKLPDLGWLGAATGLAVADLVPAALCLAVMLPAEAMPSVTGFIAIYITALALGHLIGSPGGAGPFEGILFLALPSVGAGELAAAILMYRLTYYLPAFILAAGFVATARRVPSTPLLRGEDLRNAVAWAMDESPNAEAELAWLGDKHVFFPSDSNAFFSFGVVGRIWLVMGDPIGPRDCWPGLISRFEAEAEAVGATIAIYKATTRARSFWQDRGWLLQPVGQEGTISLSDFNLGDRKHRELRRKCRSIEKAGVLVQHHEPGELPLDQADHVARAWLADKAGREQGFSMGRWSHPFASRHHSVSAWQNDQMIAFATFWTSGDGTEWMLDLMRQGSNVPNGTMHKILVTAAAVAEGLGAEKLNLCVAPLSGLMDSHPVTSLSKLGDYFYCHYNQRHGLQGSRRLKEMFRPDWKPRYLACPSFLAIPEALISAHSLIEGKVTRQQDALRFPVLELPRYGLRQPHVIEEHCPKDDRQHEAPLRTSA